MLSLYSPGYPQIPDSSSLGTQVQNLCSCAILQGFSGLWLCYYAWLKPLWRWWLREGLELGVLGLSMLASYHHRDPRKRQRVVEELEKGWLVVDAKAKCKARVQPCRWPLAAGKWQLLFSWASPATLPHRHFDFSPVELIVDFWHPGLQDNKWVSFWDAECTTVC